MSAAGLCQCGCGTPTPIAVRNRVDRGHIKGEPLPFRPGHSKVRRARGTYGGDLLAEYADKLRFASARIVGAVHDEGPQDVQSAVDQALIIEAPPGVDPVTALATVLAAQIDPLAPVETRLGWVTAGPRYLDLDEVAS